MNFLSDFHFDFEFFLTVATLITGIIWLVTFRLNDKKSLDIPKGEIQNEEQKPSMHSWFIEYPRSFFPVLLIVLLLRSFLFEPFRIPSGSMMPTLLIGDFILVNKYAYGFRLPVLHTKVLPVDDPQRGDIAVFRFPKDPTKDYIKRVIGLPGDILSYENKTLYINDEKIDLSSKDVYFGKGLNAAMNGARRYQELLPHKTHDILLTGSHTANGYYQDHVKIPEGYYFVMGDNRDNSNDSRYWGLVPEENLVGKAVLIWMNWDWHGSHADFSRVGNMIH